MKKFISKYLPDVIIIIGIWVTSYNFLRPEQKVGGLPQLVFVNHHTGYKVFGIILIAIGIDIIIRKILFRSKQQKAQDNEPSKSDIPECPSCHSQKVTLQFSRAKTDKPVPERDKTSGGCVFIESGTMKKICQMCNHVWDERELNETACLMMKPVRE